MSLNWSSIWLTVYQDPFGESRGVFNYKSILSRLDAIKTKLEAKQRSELVEETNTNSNKRKADQISSSEPDENEANQVTKKLKLDHNNTTHNVNTSVLLSSF